MTQSSRKYHVLLLNLPQLLMFGLLNVWNSMNQENRITSTTFNYQVKVNYVPKFTLVNQMEIRQNWNSLNKNNLMRVNTHVSI